MKLPRPPTDAVEGHERRRFEAASAGLGLALSLASIVLYAANGCDWTMLLLWLGALIALGAFFVSISRRFPRFERADLLVSGGLALTLSLSTWRTSTTGRFR